MSDPFDPIAPATPAAIGAFRLILEVPRSGEVADMRIEVRYEVLDADGTVLRIPEGVIAGRLSSAERTAINRVVADQLAKAVATLPA